MTFHIGAVTMCTETVTYLDVPFHRFADGHDPGAGRSIVRPMSTPCASTDAVAR